MINEDLAYKIFLKCHGELFSVSDDLNSKKLDQFYTDSKVSKYCFDEADSIIGLSNYFLLEPSAGTGSFSKLFHENSLALDLDPKIINIVRMDFLEFDYDILKGERVVSIGNPPFGKNSSLAIKFFNKASEFSDYVCFIIPRTFKKDSLVNKLNDDMHLIKEVSIDDDSFIFNGNRYKVPCIFQIWKKEDYKRDKIRILSSSEYFNFTDKAGADFAIRRVGGLAGKVLVDFDDYSPSSHYYIKSTIISKNILIKKFTDLYSYFQEVSFNSAGNPSLSKSELIKIFENFN
jgi:predicted RNA methylase